ncbi:MAG: DNA primase [Elusimicrobiota bacterium]
MRRGPGRRARFSRSRRTGALVGELGRRDKAIFDPSIKESIRERVDIVELVREHLPNLRQKGRVFMACCPFHQEKTPSFQVHPERQIFHCFGCGAGGDAFSFLMRLENLSFPEALAKLGSRVGVRVEEARREFGPQDKERSDVHAALEFARDFYHRFLLTEAEADGARTYLKGRGLTQETLEAFRLGCAPRSGRRGGAAARKGFSPELLAKAGLAARRDDGTWRDYFWARVLFPILNPRGESAGFGARVLGEGEPKYLNSPETSAFSKGKVLYGFFEGLAQIRKERSVLLMEGYMDVLAAHQYGFKTACAPLGTAVTDDHVRLLKRYAQTVLLVFDPDAAGAAAALRGAEMLLEGGLAVRVATVPGGLDPDELLRKSGVRAMEKCLSEAKDLADFRTDLLLKGRSGAFLEPEEKSRIAGQVLETARRCPDEVLKSEWLRRLSQRLDVSEESLRMELGRQPRGGGARRRPAAPPASASQRPLPATERDMLRCLLLQPALALDDTLVSEKDFQHERARSVFAALRRALPLAPSGTGWSAALLESLSAEDAAFVRGMLVSTLEEKDPARLLSSIVGRLRRERRLKEIEPLVAQATGPSADLELHAEYHRLLKELHGSAKDK